MSNHRTDALHTDSKTRRIHHDEHVFEPAIILAEVFDILKRLKSEDRTILLVEQNTHMALDVADHVYLMQGGKVTLSKPAAEVNLT
jgi:ABC-type branched-subunit amino acid transport system ATPase component